MLELKFLRTRRFLSYSGIPGPLAFSLFLPGTLSCILPPPLVEGASANRRVRITQLFLSFADEMRTTLGLFFFFFFFFFDQFPQTPQFWRSMPNLRTRQKEASHTRTSSPRTGTPSSVRPRTNCHGLFLRSPFIE